MEYTEQWNLYLRIPQRLQPSKAPLPSSRACANSQKLTRRFTPCLHGAGGIPAFAGIHHRRFGSPPSRGRRVAAGYRRITEGFRWVTAGCRRVAAGCRGVAARYRRIAEGFRYGSRICTCPVQAGGASVSERTQVDGTLGGCKWGCHEPGDAQPPSTGNKGQYRVIQCSAPPTGCRCSLPPTIAFPIHPRGIPPPP